MRLLFFLLALHVCGPRAVTAQYHIKITPVDSNIYLYTSYGDAGSYKNVDANAVVLVSGDDAMLFDTPWDDAQAMELVAFVRDSLKKNILYAVITHAHADRIGGIDAMHRNNIPTFCYQLTAIEATRHGYTLPRHIFRSADTTFRCGAIDVVAFYPGAGHTTDNIVLYIPAGKFLYGGCFIKSGLSNNIGNIEDADMAAWPLSLQNMKERFKKTGIEIVIPGHGSWETGRAIKNTQKLLEENKKGNY